ncbi:Ephrin domain containing protein [Trichuris trichiura]|uniref:Ephrin domain containing protein n=1 Tax=Trichuris trichiura TaxID=36087 RepID=A0A077YUR3_TRITR|nr:Ephrin domain containing protein [Trichuris trichiura]
MCTAPYKKQIITVVFRRYSPIPDGLEFHPGHRYYLISTSEGRMNGVQNRNGGLCLSKNMRVEFDVRDKNPVPQSDMTQLVNDVAFLRRHMRLKNASKMQNSLKNLNVDPTPVCSHTAGMERLVINTGALLALFLPFYWF